MKDFLKYYTHWTLLYYLAYMLGAPIPNPKAMVIGATLMTIVLYIKLDKNVSFEYRRQFFINALLKKALPLYLFRHQKVTPNGILATVLLGLGYVFYLQWLGLSHEEIYHNYTVGDSV